MESPYPTYVINNVHFLPKLFLQRNGFKLSERTQARPTVSKDEIGFIFAGSHDGVVDFVLANRVTAGAFSDHDYAMLDEKKKSNIAVLVQTELLPRHLLSVRTSLAPEVADGLQTILLSMHEDAEGRKTLYNTDETTKFDPLPGGEVVMRRRLLETFYSR